MWWLLIWTACLEAPTPHTPGPPPDVLLDGCTAWVDGRCHVAPGARLTVATTTDARLLLADGQTAALTHTHGHHTWTGSAAEGLALRVGTDVHPLPVTTAPAPAPPADVVALAEHKAPADADTEARVAPYATAAEAWTAAGYGARAMGAHLAVVSLLQRSPGGLPRMEAGLAAARAVAVPDLRMQAALAYNDALLHLRLGAGREALAAIDRAEELARIGDYRGLADASRSTRLEVLQDLGRHDLVLPIARAAETPDDPCTALRDRGNRAWSLYRASRALSDPTLLAEARALVAGDLERDVCEDSTLDAAITRLNLGLMAVAARDAGDARRALDLLGELPTSELQLHLHGLELAIGVARLEGTPARRLAETYVLEADLSDSVRHRWLSRQLLAEVAVDAGDVDGAIDAYDAAFEVALGSAWRIPLESGRDAFLADLNHATAAHATLLLPRDPVAAMTRVRRARAWELASLQHALALRSGPSWTARVARYEAARAAHEATLDGLWTEDDPEVATRRRDDLARRAVAHRATLAEALDVVPPDHLPTPRSPGPGETMLTRIPGGAYLAQTVDGAGIATLESLAAERLVVLPGVDVDPLTQWPARPVQWSLDLPPAAARPRTGRRALVVIDPMGNLPGARREGRAVADQLTAAGWRVTTLAGLEATRLAILDGLGDSDLLHVAAHGEVGTAPLDAWLVATDGRVTVTDLLALPAVPRTVVLAGCDTAVPAGGASSTIGLAQAFLAKGADAVVATTRPVDDAVTAVVAPSLYRHGLTTDAPSALRASVLEGLSAGLPGAQLAALRVLTP